VAVRRALSKKAVSAKSGVGAADVAGEHADKKTVDASTAVKAARKSLGRENFIFLLYHKSDPISINSDSRMDEDWV
jgi:hypothetical protein